jgi:hypothetical protein
MTQGRAVAVDPGMGMARLVRTIDMRGKQRLAAQVQAHHLGGEAGGGMVMLGQVVDEQRARGLVFFEDGLERRALGPWLVKTRAWMPRSASCRVRASR